MPEKLPGRPIRPPPVAVAGPSLGDLAADATRSWLAGLIESRPLAQAESVALAEMIREGPRLCTAVLGAVASDAELEWLVGSREAETLVARALGATGSRRPEEAVRSIEALRAALWAAITRAGPTDPAATAAAGHRLAHVCALVGALAARETAVAAAEAQDARAESDPTQAATFDVPALAGDEHDLRAVPDPPPPEPGRPLWMGALERRVAEGGRSGRRFVLLLIDVDGADRLRAAQPTEATDDPLAEVGRAIREQVRRADLLAHEADRVWVVAQDAGRTGARALAARLTEAVREAASSHGAPLTASVGMAVYPDDGRDVASLTDHAEEDMYGARARGAPVTDVTGSGR